MNPRAHEAAHCRQGKDCDGVGCRLSTGKTERKENWKRPRRNHRNVNGDGT